VGLQPLPLTNRRKMLGTAGNRRIINILCCGFFYLIQSSPSLLNAFVCHELFQSRRKKRKSAKQIIQILFYSALIRESVPDTVISAVQQLSQHSCPNPHQKGEDIVLFSTQP